MNELGSYSLSSLTFSHETDNTEGISFVIEKKSGDTIYQLNEFLNGWVALSNDGRTIAQLISEEKAKSLEISRITFFRDGKKYDSAELGKLLKYELDEANFNNKLPTSSWLRNDSILHKMASNSFYITEDKLFLSFEGPILMAFDMNQMFHIYTGNGTDHFFLNYYAIPAPPIRIEYNSPEYFPVGFPALDDGRSVNDFLELMLKTKASDPLSAKTLVELRFRLNSDGTVVVHKAQVIDLKTNDVDNERSNELMLSFRDLKFNTSLLPPKHSAWIFGETFWMK